MAEEWGIAKSKIKALTISYSAQRSWASSQVWDLLTRLAQHLKEKIESGLVSCLEVYHSVLHQLTKLDLQVARGAQVRSRVRWVEEGEASSEYFFRPEKKRLADCWISALRETDHSIISAPADLCRSFQTFYTELFSAAPIDLLAQESLLGNVSSVLPSDQARGKAPGTDSLPMEFYLKFWGLLGTDLVNVLNSCYVSGSLSLSQHQSVISLIFKKGDRLDHVIGARSPF